MISPNLFNKFRVTFFKTSINVLSSTNNSISANDFNNRLYSSASSKHYRPDLNNSYHQSNSVIFCGRCRTLGMSELTTQRRNFSIKGYFDSAVLTHSALFKMLSESTVVAKCQSFIVQFHDSTGLPWWLSVVLSTCILRFTFTLPLALYQNYIVARVENIKVEMEDFVRRIRYNTDHEVRNKRLSERRARGIFQMNVRSEWTRLIERDNCHPAKAAILAIVQIPLWVIFSTAFRNLVYKLPHNDALAQIKWLELSVGGVAWFPNLTVPDSLVIPVLLGLSNLAIVEIQTMLHKGQQSRVQRYVTNFFRGFSLFMIPVAASVPSCITLYWLTSSLFGLVQNLTILSPRVRRLVGIPLTPTTRTQPYAHLADQIRSRGVCGLVNTTRIQPSFDQTADLVLSCLLEPYKDTTLRDLWSWKASPKDLVLKRCQNIASAQHKRELSSS